MQTFKLTLAYDGTGLVGWQRQATGTSVQGLIEDVLSELDARHVAVTGAGRTDAGVHARGQVASVALARAIDSRTLVRAINAKLPETVRVLDAVEIETDFHARFDARAKTYHYRIWNAEVLSPFERSYVWHIRSPLDADAMSAAASLLVGQHDFGAFRGSVAEPSDAQRTVFVSRIRTDQTPLITYEISGDGFLRHMVRSIVGTLVEVGSGRQRAEWVGEVLRSRDRARAGRTAPASGLVLMNVSYRVVQ
jgi:tRNA pseudouridine38-40 synthase